MSARSRIIIVGALRPSAPNRTSFVSVLILLYLPIPRGLIGTSWLITQIAKSLTISPLLDRWILFIGYDERLRKRLTPNVSARAAEKYKLLAPPLSASYRGPMTFHYQNK